MVKGQIVVTIEIVTDEIAGIKKGSPMTFSQADSGNVNPDYIPYTATDNNCQSCIPAFKARLDGFNVKAKPWDDNNNVMVMLSDDTSIAWIDKVTGTFPEYIKPPETYVPRLIKWLDNNLKDETFYSFEFYTKNMIDGHIMIIFKQKNNLTLYDPQSHEIIKGNEIHALLYSIKKSSIRLINISNCFLNKAVLDYIVEAVI